MALYQHDLYLVRSDRPEGLLPSLRNSGLVRDAESGESALLRGGARALVQEGHLMTSGGVPLQVVALLIEDEYVAMLTNSFENFASWLQEMAQATDLLVAVMLGAADTSSDGPDLNGIISAIVDEKQIIAAPALLWIRSSASHESVCDLENPLYRTLRSPGLGCLFALVDVAIDGSFEILEPGPSQEHLLSAWTHTHG